MNLQQEIYSMLDGLTGGIKEFAKPGNYKKLKSGGYMDLSIECLDENRISLTHYYKVNGDLVPDPDMEVRIMPDREMAEALTFQNSLIYTVVYPGEGKVNLKAKQSMNSFLKQWLINLKNQGFYVGKVAV